MAVGIRVLKGFDQGASFGTQAVSLKVDMRQLQRLAKRLPNRMNAVISKASNKTGTHMRKVMVQRLRKDVLNVKASDLKRRNVTLKKGSAGKPGAKVTITGSRIPLIYFEARQVKKGVTYKIDPKGGRDEIRQAFIAPVNRRIGKGVLQRETKKRKPLRVFYGPSVPHALEEHPKVFEGVKKDGEQFFEKELTRAVDYELSK